MLTTLDLSENWLRYRSISWLVSAHWPALQSLNLLRTRLSPRAGVRLLDADCPLLATLDLSFVHLGHLFFSKATDGEHLIRLKHATLHDTNLVLNISVLCGGRFINVAPELQPARWPLVETFRAFSNDMICEDIISLVQCYSWP